MREISSNSIDCLGPFFFSSLAFGLGLMSLRLCNFVSLNGSPAAIMPPFPTKAGFWCFEGPGKHNEIKGSPLESHLDDEFKIARSLGLIANIIGFLVCMIYLCAGCIKYPPVVFASTSCMCLLACMFEGFKFWIFRSDFFCYSYVNLSSCNIDTASKFGISSIVFWLVAFAMATVHRKKNSNRKNENEDGDGGNDGGVALKGIELRPQVYDWLIRVISGCYI